MTGQYPIALLLSTSPCVLNATLANGSIGDGEPKSHFDFIEAQKLSNWLQIVEFWSQCAVLRLISDSLLHRLRGRCWSIAGGWNRYALSSLTNRGSTKVKSEFRNPSELSRHDESIITFCGVEWSFNCTEDDISNGFSDLQLKMICSHSGCLTEFCLPFSIINESITFHVVANWETTAKCFKFKSPLAACAVIETFKLASPLMYHLLWRTPVTPQKTSSWHFPAGSDYLRVKITRSIQRRSTLLDIPRNLLHVSSFGLSLWSDLMVFLVHLTCPMLKLISLAPLAPWYRSGRWSGMHRPLNGVVWYAASIVRHCLVLWYAASSICIPSWAPTLTLRPSLGKPSFSTTLPPFLAKPKSLSFGFFVLST